MCGVRARSSPLWGTLGNVAGTELSAGSKFRTADVGGILSVGSGNGICDASSLSLIVAVIGIFESAEIDVRAVGWATQSCEFDEFVISVERDNRRSASGAGNRRRLETRYACVYPLTDVTMVLTPCDVIRL
jgi:hypothetical protein